MHAGESVPEIRGAHRTRRPGRHPDRDAARRNSLAVARQHRPLCAGRPFRPAMASGYGHQQATRQTQGKGPRNLAAHPLCGRFRPDGNRGPASCRGAAGGGVGRARTAGAAAGAGENPGSPHRRGLHVPRLRHPQTAETRNLEAVRVHHAIQEGHPGHQGQGVGQDVQVNPPPGSRRADPQPEQVPGGLGELLPARGVQGGVQRRRQPRMAAADALDPP